ncbi:MAG: DUF1800 family protein [Chitinophagaceae bacterium]
MEHPKVSRRKFFASLRQKQKAELAGDFSTNDYDSDDPLFDKYARKTLGPREYSTEMKEYDPAARIADEVRVGNVTSGLTPYTGAWTEWEALHLLRRTGFGFKKTFVDTLLPMTSAAAVDYVMNINTAVPAPPVNWYNLVGADENAIPYGADWTTNPFPTGSVGQTTNSYRAQAMRRWLFGQALNSDDKIREKMVWFWYHFIPIDFQFISESSNSYINTNCARIFYSYFKLLRDNSLGNFKTLIRKICTEPAMMYYLNNQANSATAPDENFARELMELFTLGKDPASQYTQSDVIAAAKVLTGWRVQGLNTATIATNFVPGSHSTSNKQFSSFFGNAVINYQSGANGANELNQLIDLIFSKSEVVSQYICRKLYRYFVYYDIDANIEANVIAPLAQTFVNSNWEILPVLKQLFKSEHFFDMANRGVYIKTPFDLVVGTLRTFNITTNVADPTNYQAQYQVWSYYNDNITLNMEQQMGTIPNVSGWNPFYQTPAYHEYWINTNTIQKRFKFLQDLFNGYNLTYNSLTTANKVSNVAFAQQFGNTICADPNLLIAACIKYLIPNDLSAAQKSSIKLATLLSGQTTDSYWTTAWNTFIATPTTANTNVVETRLKSLLTTIVQLAEYQLM